MKNISGWSLGLGLAACLAARAAAPANPAIVNSQFISDDPPTPSSHASTIAETGKGLLAAWFGGTEEKALDVSIWLARYDGRNWSVLGEIANGFDEREERRYPCWNPVLFRRKNGDLLLFYKVGPSPSTWWGMVRLSRDEGDSWIKVRRLPDGFVGPVRNKPIELADGTLLCGSSTENRGWRVHMEWAKDPFGLWSRGPELNEAYTFAAIQPTILQHADGRLQILCRTKQGSVTTSWAKGGVQIWERMKRTALPNPNSAVDAVMLKDGRALLVYNHAREGRGQLNVAVSADGVEWLAAGVLEDEPGSEFSYPAVIETQDGLVHVTYTWKRERIKHVVLDPRRLQVSGLPPVPAR